MALPAPDPGSLAVVTGASSGMGAELARALAARGHRVALVARREARLQELATELREAHDVEVEVLPCDLADAASRETTIAAISGCGVVEILVNSAGFGTSGAFSQSDCGRNTEMVRTNVEAVIDLCGAFVPGMVSRRRGAILVLSSLAGMSPMPGTAAYAATKAATLSFAEALHEELRQHGVTVTAMCPGPVRTEFLEIAEMQDGVGRWPAALTPTAADCARAGLEALQNGRRRVVPNAGVRALALGARHIPHALSLRAWRPFLEY